MNPLEHTRVLVGATQDQLVRWAQGIFAQAGCPDVGVALAPTDPPVGPRLGIYPIRVGVPGRSVDAQGTALVGPPELARDMPAGMPPTWLEYARVLQAALDFGLGGSQRPPPGARPRTPPIVEEMPAQLADWYRRQAEESDQWTWSGDGTLVGRPPSLTWRATSTLKVQYVAALEGGGAEIVPLLAALSTAVALQSSFSVDCAPLPVDPLLVTFSEALARSVDSKLGAELRAAVVGLGEKSRTLVSVMPNTDLSLIEAIRYFERQGRLFSPHVQLAMFVPVGATALFAPAASPAFAMRPRRQGDAE